MVSRARTLSFLSGASSSSSPPGAGRFSGSDMDDNALKRRFLASVLVHHGTRSESIGKLDRSEGQAKRMRSGSPPTFRLQAGFSR